MGRFFVLEYVLFVLTNEHETPEIKLATRDTQKLTLKSQTDSGF